MGKGYETGAALLPQQMLFISFLATIFRPQIVIKLLEAKDRISLQHQIVHIAVRKKYEVYHGVVNKNVSHLSNRATCSKTF